MKTRGKKRLKAPEPVVTRVRRDRVLLNGLAYDFTTPSPDTSIGVGMGNTRPDADVFPIEVRFDPPLEKVFAASSTLAIVHLESKRRDTMLTILPHTEDKRLVQSSYFEFVTHTCKVDEAGVHVLYFTITNEQLRGDCPVPIWRPNFNLGLGFEPRYKSLPFFPPDTPLSQAVDLSQIPQNTGYPLSHKPAGGVSSSRVPKLLGFYPGPDAPFNGWRSAAVRFGRMSESKSILMYLAHHQDYTYSETGFRSLENGGLLDGAMCDGIVTGPSGETFPLEIKASRTNCNFEAAHVAQVIWQLACGYSFADLVRYCERQVKDANGLWKTHYECKEIRLYRHPGTEKTIIELCQQSHALQYKDFKAFDALVQTPPYVEMRKQLEALTEQANKDAKTIPVDESILERLEQYKSDTLATQNIDNQVSHPLLDRIENRQARIFAAFQEADAETVRKEVREQLRDYTEML